MASHGNHRRYDVRKIRLAIVAVFQATECVKAGEGPLDLPPSFLPRRMNKNQTKYYNYSVLC